MLLSYSVKLVTTRAFLQLVPAIVVGGVSSIVSGRYKANAREVHTKKWLERKPKPANGEKIDVEKAIQDSRDIGYAIGASTGAQVGAACTAFNRDKSVQRVLNHDEVKRWAADHPAATSRAHFLNSLIRGLGAAALVGNGAALFKCDTGHDAHFLQEKYPEKEFTAQEVAGNPELVAQTDQEYQNTVKTVGLPAGLLNFLWTYASPRS